MLGGAPALGAAAAAGAAALTAAAMGAAAWLGGAAAAEAAGERVAGGSPRGPPRWVQPNLLDLLLGAVCSELRFSLLHGSRALRPRPTFLPSVRWPQRGCLPRQAAHSALRLLCPLRRVGSQPGALSALESIHEGQQLDVSRVSAFYAPALPPPSPSAGAARLGAGG